MKTPRPKILLYSTHLPYPLWDGWGGADKVWYETILHSRMRNEFHCLVMLPDSPVPRARGEYLQSLGVSVDWYSTIQPSVAKRIGRRVMRMVQGGKAGQGGYPWVEAIKRYCPALVWFNLSTIGDLAFLDHASAVCRRARLPYWLFIHHGFEQFFPRSDEQMECLATVVEGAKRVVCIAQRNRATLERALGRRLGNIWMYVTAVSHEFLEQAAAMSKSKVVRIQGPARLLNLARFDPSCKGQHILLEILSDSRWQKREWCVTFQGGGQLTLLLERLIKFYGTPADRVKLCQHTSDILSVIGDSDLLVMPSLSEGTPFALVETMACGRPAVGTPVGGIPELIVEGETGWLARSTEVADVADALERAWAYRHQWPMYGANARAKVAATYDRDYTIVDLVKAIYEDT